MSAIGAGGEDGGGGASGAPEDFVQLALLISVLGSSHGAAPYGAMQLCVLSRGCVCWAGDAALDV